DGQAPPGLIVVLPAGIAGSLKTPVPETTQVFFFRLFEHFVDFSRERSRRTGYGEEGRIYSAKL
ncbi:MAG TPA: hypothetical protein VFU95_10080, partial [Telluria sp.]|nr:hypothetical protein [Telluria sp.]